MRVYIGILLIVVSSVLFTVLLPENTPWIYVTGPLFIIGFGFIQSKIHEMEEDIGQLKEELEEAIKKLTQLKHEFLDKYIELMH